MKVTIIVLYIMAGILTANLIYTVDKNKNAVHIPATYIVLGASWPIVTVVSTIVILFPRNNNV